ncbi:hypothetical protein EB809_07635 [Marinobacter sp. R17]|uniref:pilus assembly protein n=1 Tax=Marinobacter sp. R17 TaxID=2484250 RepID=UPI000F4C24E6|nr:PilC/PilY family type IV pilus protein [Marinobacter sp. R17]ROU00649.1 hypothetical protein EB809_07635 [Marinobacter sp. R17]
MKFYSRIAHVLAGFLIGLPAMGYSAVPISSTPLFLSGSAKPNILFAVDDSGSMDFETVTDYDTGGHAYLFNSGGASNNNYDGGWLTNTGSNGQVPFVRRYYFLRSSDYNAAYYNPDSTYQPWPDGTSNQFSDSDPTSAPYEPTNSGSKTLNLTQNTTDQNGNTFYPATYFSKTTSGGVKETRWVCSSGYEYWGPYNGRQYCYSQKQNNFQQTTTTEEVVTSCGDLTYSDYNSWYNNPNDIEFTGDVDALAPDGGCLVEHKIQSGTGDMQNFANWFSYYRRLHQATRGSIAEALSGLAGVNLGMFWIHNQRQVSMYDIDSEKGDFLDDSYEHFGSSWSGGGTPLRGTLKHAGNQFSNNSNLITAECQKNYTLLFTDGFNNASISGIGNADEDKGAPYEDDASNTLADVAMKYYDTRLRSGTYDAGKVRLGEGCYKKEGDPGYSSTENIPVESTDPSYDPSADCNADLHMNTYTVGFGNKGENFAGLAYNKVADAYTSPPDWSEVNSTSWDGDQVDDLYHAAVNGRGEFYNATDVDQLRSAMSKALRDIIKTTGAATNVTFNTATLEEGSNVYTASFNSGDWTGSVAARALNAVTGSIGSVVWDAADTLNSKDPDSRFIVTNNGGGVLFNWDNLSATQKDDLNGSEGTDAAGQKRLAYIRGDDANEGTLYRERSTILGDVVNSSPVYVGQPASSWPDRDPFGATSDRYSSFRMAQQDRTPVVYAGANDGMLHGFKAEDGDEVVGYIPASVYSNADTAGLHYLTNPEYRHRFYTDLSPTVADIFIDPAGGSADTWMTTLIGGLRGGGRGIFALNVTDPGAFTNADEDAAKLLMWEFTSDDDSRLGYVTEPPLVALVKWGNNDYRWSALLPNGYGTGQTGLFVLDIEAGLDGWDNGDYVYIPLDSSGSGLSPLRAVDYKDTNGDSASDGIVDRIYAGDPDGQLWAIDMTGASNQWGSAYKQGSTPQPMFIAKDSSGNTQPITAAPTAGRNFYNTNGSAPNLMVFVGTGRYLSETDPSSTADQSFYGIWDKGEKVDRSDLTSRSITLGSNSGQDTRTVSGSGIDWTDSDTYGWYFDLPEEGERVISDVLLRGQYVLFNTITPTESVCQSGGTSWIMVVKFDGTTPDKAVLDVDNDGDVDGDDAIVAGVRNGALIFNMNVLSENLYSQRSDGQVDKKSTDLLDGKSLGRSGWREIYQE